MTLSFRSGRVAVGLSRRWRAGLLTVACLAGGGAAQAQLWFYVDSEGIAHFSSERTDPRYQLFSMAQVTADEAGLHIERPVAAQAPVAQASTADREKLQRFVERSKGYQLHSKHIQAAAKKHGVEEALLKAVATAESGFNPQAVSPKGAVGLMQVIPDTAERFGVAGDKRRTLDEKLKDPAINVPLGARYLRYLQSLFPGRTDLVLAAYNAGEGAVQRHGNKIPPYKETQNYVKTVMALYASLQPLPAPGPAPTAAGHWTANGDSISTLSHAQLQSSPINDSRLRMTLPAPAAAASAAAALPAAPRP